MPPVQSPPASRHKKKSLMKKISLLIALAVGLLAGCTLAPKYQRPVAPVSQTWPSGPVYAGTESGGFTTNAAADIGWRGFYHDARLQELISPALPNHRAPRLTVLTLAQSRA